MAEGEPTPFDPGDDDPRIWEPKQRVNASREERGIIGGIDDMSDELFEEMATAVLGDDLWPEELKAL
jgi:hypothetical protein